jgi:hypothetical protein
MVDVDDERRVRVERQRRAQAIDEPAGAAGERGLEAVERDVARDFGLFGVVVAQGARERQVVEAAQAAAPVLDQIGAIHVVVGAHEQPRPRAEQPKQALAHVFAVRLQVELVASLGLAGDRDEAVVLEHGAAGGERAGVAEVGRRLGRKGVADVVAQVPADDGRQPHDGHGQKRALGTRRQRQSAEFVCVGRGVGLVGHRLFPKLAYGWTAGAAGSSRRRRRSAPRGRFGPVRVDGGGRVC